MEFRRDWWKEAVAYQIYPKSFYDTNGDGVGDLRGITEKMDYLADLGIDILWISPMFQSPMDDNGYDISDYYKVAAEFGTNEDMEELLAKAKEKNIKVMLDLVLNHCSDEHQWFQTALKDPHSEEAGYFYFRKTDNGMPPNNWQSNFGGSVWERTEDGRYYYHAFGKKQPDLNWENPKLREKLYEMIRWWIKKGVDGFRIDAITFIKKDLTFENHYPTLQNGKYPVENMLNYPGIGDFLSEMRDKVFAPGGSVTVAEAPGVPYEELEAYAGSDGYFSMLFDFSYADFFQYIPGYSLQRFIKKVIKSQSEYQRIGWCGTFLENHDQPRSVSKYIPEQDLKDFPYRSKTMLAGFYFMLRGTPFIYQGQEIGMEDFPFISRSQFHDIRSIRLSEELIRWGKTEDEALDEYKHITRDNARTPMQWSAEANAGFSEAKPWFHLNPNYREINVASQMEDPKSVRSFYKCLIQLRKDPEWKDTIVYGDFEYIHSDYEDVVLYSRQFQEKRLFVICNFSAEEKVIDLPRGIKKVMLTNSEITQELQKGLLCEAYAFYVVEV